MSCQFLSRETEGPGGKSPLLSGPPPVIAGAGSSRFARVSGVYLQRGVSPPSSGSSAASLVLEIGHGVNIYTTDIGKCYNFCVFDLNFSPES